MAVAVLLPARCRHGAAAKESSKEDHLGGGANTGSTRIALIDSYRIIKKIGQRGYGAISKARHVESGDRVAIKLSLHAGGEAAVAALLREASMFSACAGNPTVVWLKNVVRGSDTHDLHLVMEYVAGRSLYDVICSRQCRGNIFLESETHRVMAELLAGISTIHAHGIIHRDLKPGNVLVGAEGSRLRISDLGLATSIVALPMDDTGLGGTPRYMAADLLLGEKDCGDVDAWALGCIMADLVAGQPLFPEEDLCQHSAAARDLLGIPDDVSLMPLGVSGPSKLRERVPKEQLSPAGFDVLQGLLEYNPKDRLPAIAALKMPWFTGKD